MSSFVIMFPGQGAQTLGMGKDLFDKFDFVKELFEQASELSSFDMKKLIFDGPMEDLTMTDCLQPAITTVNIALYEALIQACPHLTFSYTLGHSLGEYAALYAAGCVDFATCLKLVSRRGALMHQTAQNNPGAMIAVMNASNDRMLELVEENQLVVNLANYNSPAQTILSGKSEDIEKITALLKADGVKRIIPLKVSGPWHSPLMKDAQNAFIEDVNKCDIKEAALPLISNVDAKPHSAPAEIKQNLIDQITGSVQWVNSVEYLLDKQQYQMIECGPGKVLAGLIKRFKSQAVVTNIPNLTAIENLKESV